MAMLRSSLRRSSQGMLKMDSQTQKTAMTRLLKLGEMDLKTEMMKEV